LKKIPEPHNQVQGGIFGSITQRKRDRKATTFTVRRHCLLPVALSARCAGHVTPCCRMSVNPSTDIVKWAQSGENQCKLACNLPKAGFNRLEKSIPNRLTSPQALGHRRASVCQSQIANQSNARSANAGGRYANLFPWTGHRPAIKLPSRRLASEGRDL